MQYPLAAILYLDQESVRRDSGFIFTRDENKRILIESDHYSLPHFVEKTVPKCKNPYTKFCLLSIYSYQCLPACKSVILWWFAVADGL